MTIPLIEKGIFQEKEFWGWARMEMTWSWGRFEDGEPLGRRNDDDLLGCKSTDPLQKEKQSKTQINQKKKKRAKSRTVTTLTPLKKSRPRDLISQGTSITWGHRFQLGYPFSFIYCSPKNFRWSTYLALGWFASPFPKFWRVFSHIPNPFYWREVSHIYGDIHWIWAYIFFWSWKPFLLLPWGCFK